MGVDWRTLGWLDYQMMLAGWNEAHDTDKSPSAPDLERLKRFTAAHTLQ